MKTIINENQRGLLFKNGRFVKPLAAGSYFTFGNSQIEVLPLQRTVVSNICTLDALRQNETFQQESINMSVGNEELALHFVDGRFVECLICGEYAFWKRNVEHEFHMVDISIPDVSSEVPRYIFARIPAGWYTKVEVSEYEKARLYFDGKLVRLLDAGTHYFWNGATKVTAETVDLRRTQMDITGQDILTRDKVTVRVNFVCTYRIVDCIKVVTEIDDYAEQLHVAAQLALREYVGRYAIDELLENRDQLSSFVLERLKNCEKDLYIEILDAGVKDIILPGEIRDIMNTVLVAEKRAQANVITRREEVASTRSLLNTARLMEENQTLYKLKELEYLEKICENVGSVNVGGNGGILTALTAAIENNH